MSKRNFSVSLQEIENDEIAIKQLEGVLAERKLNLDAKRKRLEKQNEHSLITMPNDILHEIILQSDRKTIGQLVQTNRRLHQYWNLHQERYIDYFWNKEYGDKYPNITDKVGWWSSTVESNLPIRDYFRNNSFVIDCNLPPGQYYVGDISYVLSDDVYADIWGKKYNFEDGKYTIKYKNNEGMFAVASTAHGNGSYRGSNKKYFHVDAGVIGIISRSLCAKQDTYPEDTTFIDSSTPIRFQCDRDGLFQIIYTTKNKEKLLKIKTGYPVVWT